MKKNFIAILSLLLMTALLFYPKNVSVAVVSALKLCAYTVIPSLFPFAVASNILIKSNSFSSDSMLSKVFSKVFNCAPAVLPAFLSGIAGGYPIGAITATEMYKNGLCSKYDAQKALSFCCLGGPSFIISAMGASMLGNSKSGIFLYICHFVSAMLTGIILRSFFCKDGKYKTATNQKSVSFSFCLTSALKESTSSMLSVCSCVVFFSAVTAVLSALKIDYPYITAFLEMTTGVKELSSSSLPVTYLLPSLSACVAFGGLSVHSQVISVCSQTDISTKPFFIGKTVHAFLAFFITLFSQNLLGYKAVFSVSTSSNNDKFSVLVMSFIIFCLATYKKRWKKNT